LIHKSKSERQVAPNNSHSSFWERLHLLFTRGRPYVSQFDDPPRRRGIAISFTILMSGVLWFTFSMQETYTAEIYLPTEVVNLPAEQALTALPPSVVAVQVQGEGLTLIRLHYNPPSFTINAEQDEVILAGEVPQMLNDVLTLNVSPGSYRLEKERRITRPKPILSRVQIDIPPTHDLIGPIMLSPDSVLVSGAESIVQDLSSWPTETITFEDQKDSLVVNIALADTLNGLVARSIDGTVVTAVIGQFTEGVREIDVEVTGVPSSQTLVALDPQSIRVRYRVFFDQYEDALLAPDFHATVSFDQILSDTTGRVRPQVHLPPNLILLDPIWTPTTLQYYQRLE